MLHFIKCSDTLLNYVKCVKLSLDNPFIGIYDFRSFWVCHSICLTIISKFKSNVCYGLNGYKVMAVYERTIQEFEGRYDQSGS